MKLSQDLIKRGFIHQISTTTLADIIDGEKKIIYHGIDPSADSAHVGNMVIWMLLKHLALAGHKIIFLIGGGTGMIGDPKPDAERQLKDPELVIANVNKLKKQVATFFNGDDIEFVDNFNWLGELKLIDFLRDIGKHYTVNELIKKDAIATRLNSDTGLSYTEFAYPLLQGFDYYQLFKTKGCTVQVGGSDQWGNMISGVELVRRKLQTEVFAITVPLIIDKSTGKKFGKSEGNAVWLDETKTSPYQFYQFWLNTSDDNVIDYLKLYTLMSVDEINEIASQFNQKPESRLAQKQLAFTVTEIVHGSQQALFAKNVSSLLFGDKVIADLSEAEILILLNNAPTCTIDNDSLLVDVLVFSNLASSKREARTFIESGAVTLDENKIDNINYNIYVKADDKNIKILKRGKKKICILKIK